MRTLFNDGWKFVKLPVKNPEFKEGEKPVLLDPCDFYLQRPAPFNAVHIPHDWLISQAKDLYENSVGFYKKSFTLSVAQEKSYFLRFEGVYMNSAVYVNGKLACIWKYGYTTFECNVTPFVKDGENVVEVVAVYQCPNTRWYSGAGIFRDVYLVETEDARIASDGVYFVTKKENAIDLPHGDWNISVQTEVAGAYAGCTVRNTIVSLGGKTLALVNEAHAALETKTLNPPMGTTFNP